MAVEKKKSEPLNRATSASQRRCTVKLNELKLDPEKFCHREEEEFKSKEFDLFLESLILEGGVLVPVVFYTDAQNQKVLVSGHRRVRGCRALVERHQAGFTADMDIEAMEVLEASAIDHLVQSISDNENRQNLSQVCRLRTVKKMHDAGVELKRAARALGVSDTTYSRDLKIVSHLWLYQHVEDESMAPTAASDLIKAAETANWVKGFKENLDEWIAERKKEIKEKARRHKAKTGKDLQKSDLTVKKQMPSHLVKHWIECIQEKRDFDEADWDYPGSIDSEGKINVPSFSGDLNKMSTEKTVKVLSRLSQIVKQMKPFILERDQIEKNRRQDTQKSAPYDFDLLRDMGLTEKAQQLEEKYQRQLTEVKDGEPDEGHGQEEEREEVDLADSILLPGTGGAGPTGIAVAIEEQGGEETTGQATEEEQSESTTGQSAEAPSSVAPPAAQSTEPLATSPAVAPEPPAAAPSAAPPATSPAATQARPPVAPRQPTRSRPNDPGRGNR